MTRCRCFDELVDQAGGRGEADAMPLAAGGQAQGDRQVGGHPDVFGVEGSGSSKFPFTSVYG